ncbi:MAG: glycosyltransferase family 2 protein [Rubrivivax sp.]|nr:glycosyltransferase family 2 protein [Rubrivivax sp.]MDP3613942.1 glycosyltransferase family 2 protein [Rubrivivax sp.]
MTGLPSSEGSLSRVYIVILNWNGWRDTIECLESLWHLQGVAWTAVVADNGSSDGSPQHLQAWAHGHQAAAPTPFLSQLPCAKPVAMAKVALAELDRPLQSPASVVLIENGENLGFAGGCNTGIRLAMAQPDCAYVWVLNNDSVVDPGALRAMLDLCQAQGRVGVCGSQIRYYDRPQLVQNFGGTLNRWFFTVHSIACGVPAQTLPAVAGRVDYVPGASMLVTREFLRRVGPMPEDYFLYYEEVDWVERARWQFDLAITRDSIVYHRGGASIGSPMEPSVRGLRSDYFMLRGRVRLARRFYPARLPVVYLGLLASLGTRLLRRQWQRAQVAAWAIVGRAPAWLDLPVRAQKS